MSGARVYIDAQIQLRRDIDENWAKIDPVLLDGEIAYSKDLERMKVGDGAHKWSELDYIITDGDASSAWFIDKDGNLATDKNVVIRGDMASGAPGQQTTVSVTKIIVNGTTYPATNGAIDISKAFQGLQVDLTPYAKTADIEATYAKKTELEAIQEGVNTSLKNVYSKDETNGLLKKYVLLEATSQTIKGALSIEGNLLVKGDVASSAPGQATTVGITGIKLNGKTHRDTDSDGVIDLGTIQAGMASVSWEEVQDKPTFAAVATSGKYSDLSGLPTIPSLTGYATETWVKNQKYITGINADMITGALTYTPANQADLANYLPSAGGELSGGLRINAGNFIIAQGRGDAVVNQLYPTATNTYALGTASRVWADVYTQKINGYTPINTNNIGSYALPSAGGAIKGDLYPDSSLARNLGKWGVAFSYTYTNHITSGSNSNNLWLISGADENNRGIVFARTSDGTNHTQLGRWTAIGLGIGTNSPVYRLDVNGSTRITGDLLVSGDVASGEAGQTTTAYLPLTGGTINGNLSLKGCLHISQPSDYSYDQGIRINSSATQAIAAIWLCTKNASGYDTGMWGITASATGNLRFRGGASSAADLMNITQGGNVGIGTTSPAYKLDVNGTGRFLNTLTIEAASVGLIVHRSSGAPYIRFGMSSSSEYGELGVNNNGNLVFWSLVSSNPAYNAWNVILNSKNYSSIINGSDVRFKNKWRDFELGLDAMANAPLFVYTWNDGRDFDEHLGSTAQYWESIAPWTVDGIDFKALNYSVLGAAMGISLARIMRDFDARLQAIEKQKPAA